MMADYITQAEKAAKEYEEQRKKQAQQQIAALNSQYDQQLAAAQTDVAEQTATAERDYQSEAETIALQRELDLRDIREARANSGLSRSGLSSTEQTAAVLAAGNRTAAARQNKDAVIAALNKSLMEYQTQIETSRSADTLSANQSAESDAAAYRQQVLSDAYDAQAKEASAAASAAKTAESTRLSTLKTLLSREEDGIDAQVYALAVENGWSATQAQAYQQNKAQLADLLEKGVISQAAYGDALANGYTAASVAQVQQQTAARNTVINQYTAEVRKLLGVAGRAEGPSRSGNLPVLSYNTATTASPTQKQQALEYLFGLLSNGYVDAEIFAEIGNTLGFTQEDIQNYAPRTVASVTKAGSNITMQIN